MRFASFCGLTGAALLAGHLVLADAELGGDELKVDLGGLGIDAGLDAQASEELKVKAVDAISPEVLEGLTLTPEQEEELGAAEGHVFQAEVSRMMKLIINSIYKNKEIFLRELISNASDALDKIRLKALTDRSVLNEDTELRVRIRGDKTNNVLHIEDTGIGMTREDLVKNLGTIAKSGTAEFMEKIEQGNSVEASSLIGQFGVGFYSAFLVADKIVVTSKAEGDDQHVWTSDATAFSVIKDPRGNTLERGTRISLYLKPEATEFLQESTLDSLVAKYSEFIDFPIYSWTETERVIESEGNEADAEVGDDDADDAEEGDDDAEEGDDEDYDEDGDVEDEEEEEEEEVKTELVWDYKLMNSQKPIWTRDPKDVEAEEYTKFYKSVARNDYGEPLGHIHFKADGTEVGFRSILYIPSVTNVAGNQQEAMTAQLGKNIRLFVRRVFITEHLEDFIPRYLWFIKGLVDSDDLPLNVSRETLQAHRLLKVIKKKVIRKILEMFANLAESDEEKFAEFYKVHSSNLKLGIIEDNANRNRLANLLRFETSKSSGVSLSKYVENIKEGQKHIYYVAGPDLEACKNSPFIEQLKKKDLEVLFMTDPIDEYALQNLPEYKELKFMNVAKDDIKFDDETEDNEARKQHFEALDEAYTATKDYLKDMYSDVVGKVVVSTRLDESPCVLVASQFGWSGNMQRIMESQVSSNRDPQMGFYSSQKKTLEINPRHPLIKKLRELVDGEETTETTKDLAEVLLDTALLRSGYPIKDEVLFSGRIERMLRVSMGVPVDEAVEPLQEFEANPVVEDEADEEEEVAGDEEDVPAGEEDDSKDEL